MAIKGLNWKVVCLIVLLVLFSRAMIGFVGYMGTNLFSSYTEPSIYEDKPGMVPDYGVRIPYELHDTEPLQLKDFIKFDSYAYLNIATVGYDQYDISEPHPPANWVFFPLYPTMMELVAKPFQWLGNIELAAVGIALSNVLFVFALMYVYGVSIQHGLDERRAKTVLIMLLIFPTSIFFSLPYTESLFLLLSAASLYYATEKKYALAFLAASLSTVTRVPGFLNLFFVIGTVVLDVGFTFSKRYIRYACYSLLSLVPMGIYLLYMKWLTGDLLAPFHEQDNWFRQTAIPFENFVRYFSEPYFEAPGGWDNGMLSFVISAAVFIIYLAYAFIHGKRWIKEPSQLLFWVYGALLIVIPFSSQPWFLSSVVRYLMVCIPFFIYLAKLTENRDSIRFAYQLLFVAVHVIMTIGFFNDYMFMA